MIKTAFQESINLNIIANPAKGGGLNTTITQLITIETKLASIAKLSATIRPLALGAVGVAQAGVATKGAAVVPVAQMGQAIQATETLNQKTQKMKQTFVNTQKSAAQYGTAIIETTNKQGQLIRTYQSTDGALTKVNQTTGKLLGSTKKLTTGFLGSGQALGAIISKVAVWTIVTTAIFKTIGTITGAIKEFIEFSQMMKRVQTATRATIGTLDQDMKRLAESVYSYMKISSASFKDTGEALYHLGSAGMNVREQMTGLEPIMNLTIGTFGNLTEVARLAAGSYNVFGESLEGAMTTTQKFKYISDLMAYTYSTQQVELSEISNAMTLVGSAAGVMKIPFNVLVGTIGELNTGLLRGTRAGTSLMNSLIALAQKSGQLKTKFGLVFDPSKPLDFVDVMEQMHSIFGDSTISLEDMGALMQTFGRRGGRAIASILGRFKEWRETVRKTGDDFQDFAEMMRETAEDTLPKQWAKFWNKYKIGAREGFKDTESLLKNILKITNQNTEAAIRLKEATKRGKKLGLSMEEEEAVSPYQSFELSALAEAKKMLGDIVKKKFEAQEIAKESEKNVYLMALDYAGLGETFDRIHETKKEIVTEEEKSKNLSKLMVEDTISLKKALEDEKNTAVDIEDVILSIVRKRSEEGKMIDKVVVDYYQLLSSEAKRYKITGSIGTATSKLTKEIEKQSILLKNQSKYRVMAIQGASELEIAEEKITDWIAKQKKKLADANEAAKKSHKEEIEKAKTLLEVARVRGLDVESAKELVKALVAATGVSKDELVIRKLLIIVGEKRLTQQEKIRHEIELTHKYTMMELRGYTEVAVIQAKIDDLAGEITKKEKEGLPVGEKKLHLLELENKKTEAILQNDNDIAEESGKISTRSEKTRKEIGLTHKYTMLQLQGSSEVAVIQVKINDLVGEITKKEKEGLSVDEEKLDLLKLENKKTEEIQRNNNGIVGVKREAGKEEEKIRREMELTHKYTMLQLQGYSEIAVTRAEISDLVEKITQKEREGVSVGGERLALLELEYRKIENIQQKVNSIASALRDNIAAGLDDIITGSGDLESIFVSLGNTIRKEMVNNLVEGSGLIQKLTQGLGKTATGQGTVDEKIKVAFITGSETTHNKIKTALIEGGIAAGGSIKKDMILAAQSSGGIVGGGGVVGAVSAGGVARGPNGGILGGRPFAKTSTDKNRVAVAGGGPGGTDVLASDIAGGTKQGFFQKAGYENMPAGMTGLAGAGMAGYASGGARGAAGGMAGMVIGMALTPILGPLGPIVGALAGMAISGGSKTETVTSTWQPQRAGEAAEKGFRGEGYAPKERLYPLPESAYFSGRAGGQGMGMDNSIHINIDNVNGDAEGIANRIADVIEQKVATKYRRSLNRGINVTFPRA